MFMEFQLRVEPEAKVSHEVCWGDLLLFAGGVQWDVYRRGVVSVSGFCEMHEFIFDLV